MKSCIKCNIDYDDGKKFCKECGSPLESIQKFAPQHEARKEVLEEKIKADPLNVELLKEYAGFLADLSLYNEAINAGHKVLAINENEKGIKAVLFRVYAGQKSWDKAIETAEEVFPEKSGDTAFLYQLAVCYKETGMLDKANSLYDAVLKIEPDHNRALYDKALVLLEDKQLVEAASIFGKLKASGKDDEMTNIYAGIDKVIKQEYEAAVEMLKPVLSGEHMAAEYADHSRGFLVLAYALMNTDASFPDIRKRFWRIDLSALKEDNHAQDEEWYVAIASHLLDYELEHFSATTEYATIEKFKEVKAAYLERQESCLTNRTRTMRARMWHQFALKQQQMKRIADALTSLEKATALDPDDSQHREKLEEVKKLNERNKKRKKKRTIIVSVISLALILILITSIQINNRFKENKAWETAQEQNTYSSYEEYMKTYPEGRFIEKAVNLQEEVLWEKAKEMNTAESFDDYLKKFPYGKHVDDAKELKEDVI